MEDKSALLRQLRIDRSPGAPPTRLPRLVWALAIVGVLVVLVAVGVWLLRSRSKVATAPAVAESDTAAGAAAAAGSGAASPGHSLLDASGYVVALRQATVSAKGIYKVGAVLVEEGQHVKQGQIIARLDDTNVHASLDQSKAQVEQLKAALAAAKLAADDAQPIFQRSQRQLNEGLISPDAFDAAKSAYDAAQSAAAVAAQNLAVAQATAQINQRYEDDTVIRAPFDGVVTVKNAQPGEIVSPQFQGGGGIAQVVDMDSLEVDVDVSENYISRVHPGQPATIKLNAYPDWAIPAEVIAIVPTADRSKATVKVRVGFRQRDARIVPEMEARVSFLADTPTPSG